MSSSNQSGLVNTLLYALMGFTIGLFIVVIATVIGLLDAGLPITAQNAFQIHLDEPLLWLIASDSVSISFGCGFHRLSGKQCWAHPESIRVGYSSPLA